MIKKNEIHKVYHLIISLLLRFASFFCPFFCLILNFVSQTKLDFGSPKPPRRRDLEEEASVDFVFIPPETKERVLTEHQKEVKRTKRSDPGLLTPDSEFQSGLC